MAEQFQIRKVKLNDGTELEYDGRTVAVVGPDGHLDIPVGGADDENALQWLITGRRSARGQKRASKPKGGKGGPGATAVTEPATVVPGGDT